MNKRFFQGLAAVFVALLMGVSLVQASPVQTLTSNFLVRGYHLEAHIDNDHHECSLTLRNPNTGQRIAVTDGICTFEKNPINMRELFEEFQNEIRASAPMFKSDFLLKDFSFEYDNSDNGIVRTFFENDQIVSEFKDGLKLIRDFERKNTKLSALAQAQEAAQDIKNSKFDSAFDVVTPERQKFHVELTDYGICVTETLANKKQIHSIFKHDELGVLTLENLSSWISNVTKPNQQRPYVEWEEGTVTHTGPWGRLTTVFPSGYRFIRETIAPSDVAVLREKISNELRYFFYLDTKKLSDPTIVKEFVHTMDAPKFQYRIEYKGQPLFLFANNWSYVGHEKEYYFHARLWTSKNTAIEFVYNQNQSLEEQVEATLNGQSVYMLLFTADRDPTWAPWYAKVFSVSLYGLDGQRITQETAHIDRSVAAINRAERTLDLLTKYHSLSAFLENAVEAVFPGEVLDPSKTFLSTDEEIRFTIAYAEKDERATYTLKIKHTDKPLEKETSIQVATKLNEKALAWEKIKKELAKHTEEVRANPSFLESKIEAYGLALKQHVFQLSDHDQVAWEPVLKSFEEILKDCSDIKKQNKFIKFFATGFKLKRIRKRLEDLDQQTAALTKDGSRIGFSSRFFKISDYLTVTAASVAPTLTEATLFQSSHLLFYSIFSDALKNHRGASKLNHYDPSSSAKYQLTIHDSRVESEPNQPKDTPINITLILTNPEGVSKPLYFSYEKNTVELFYVEMAFSVVKALSEDLMEGVIKALPMAGYRQNALLAPCKDALESEVFGSEKLEPPVILPPPPKHIPPPPPKASPRIVKI